MISHNSLPLPTSVRSVLFFLLPARNASQSRGLRAWPCGFLWQTRVSEGGGEQAWAYALRSSAFQPPVTRVITTGFPQVVKLIRENCHGPPTQSMASKKECLLSLPTSPGNLCFLSDSWLGWLPCNSTQHFLAFPKIPFLYQYLLFPTKLQLLV